MLSQRKVRTYAENMQQYKEDHQGQPDININHFFIRPANADVRDAGLLGASLSPSQTSSSSSYHHVVHGRKPHLKALEVTSVSMLEDLLAGPNNVAIDFYKTKCPYCKSLSPIWNQIARQIHTTNNEPGSVPIIIAKMDGVKFKDELNAMRPGWSEGRGYPTLLFKRVDGETGEMEATEWDPKNPRTYESLLLFMSDYFRDPSLRPLLIDLVNLMDNPDPEFTFLYSNATPFVLRFSRCVSDMPMVDVGEGNVECAAVFYKYPQLARRGSALPVNDMDRLDFPVPAIIDNETGMEHRYRDCQRWIKQKVLELEQQGQ